MKIVRQGEQRSVVLNTFAWLTLFSQHCFVRWALCVREILSVANVCYQAACSGQDWPFLVTGSEKCFLLLLLLFVFILNSDRHFFVIMLLHSEVFDVKRLYRFLARYSYWCMLWESFAFFCFLRFVSHSSSIVCFKTKVFTDEDKGFNWGLFLWNKLAVKEHKRL